MRNKRVTSKKIELHLVFEDIRKMDAITSFLHLLVIVYLVITDPQVLLERKHQTLYKYTYICTRKEMEVLAAILRL